MHHPKHPTPLPRPCTFTSCGTPPCCTSTWQAPTPSPGSPGSYASTSPRRCCRQLMLTLTPVMLPLSLRSLTSPCPPTSCTPTHSRSLPRLSTRSPQPCDLAKPKYITANFMALQFSRYLMSHLITVANKRFNQKWISQYTK